MPDLILLDETEESDEADEAPPQSPTGNVPRRGLASGRSVEPVDRDASPLLPAGRSWPELDPPVVWFTLGLLQDAAFVSGDDVCAPGSQINGQYVCLRSSGGQYHGSPRSGAAGTVPPGIRLATTRISGALFVPVGAWSFGLRGGWAVAGQGPRAAGGSDFFPLQVEGQVARWMSGDAFSATGVDLFFLVSGGVAQIDGRSYVNVTEDTAVTPPAHQLDNPPAQSLDAYRRSGPGFAGLGLGVFLPMGSWSGVVVDLRGVGLFPTRGGALSLGVSVAFGI